MTNRLEIFVAEAEQQLQREYEDIQSRRKLTEDGREVLEDPGTSGDLGEENWAHIIRQWLPKHFTVKTKGRLLFPDGTSSPQVDIVVLAPSYPSFLLDRNDKYYLSSGVAAVFECKITGTLDHIKAAFEAGSIVAGKYRRTGLRTPHSELNSIPFGLLCHKFRGKKKRTERWADISNKLISCVETAHGPKSLIDFICVADTAYWGIHKSITLSPNPAGVGQIGVMAGYFSELDLPPDFFLTEARVLTPPRDEAAAKPVGRFLVGLYHRLSRDFPEMRGIASDISDLGAGQGPRSGTSGGPAVTWPLEHCFSPEVLQQLQDGKEDREMFGAWSFLQGT